MTLLDREQTSLEEIRAQLDVLVAEAEERRALRESLAELTSDLSPITKQGMSSISTALSAADERGYIDFARGGASVIDRVVTSFTQDDLEALGENVVLILETVKEMTQPEVMQMMKSTLHNVQEVEEPTEPPSLVSLFRELRKPEARRGLYRLVAFLQSLGDVESTMDIERKETPK